MKAVTPSRGLVVDMEMDASHIYVISEKIDVSHPSAKGNGIASGSQEEAKVTM